MNREDIGKLLGGYATGTLTPEEREALFGAALHDQELFDALAREQSLRDLLRDPAARAHLLAALDRTPAPWLRRWRFPLAVAVSAAGVAALGLIVVRQHVRPARSLTVAQVARVQPELLPDRPPASAPRPADFAVGSAPTPQPANAPAMPPAPAPARPANPAVGSAPTPAPASAPAAPPAPAPPRPADLAVGSAPTPQPANAPAMPPAPAPPRPANAAVGPAPTPTPANAPAVPPAPAPPRPANAAVGSAPTPQPANAQAVPPAPAPPRPANPAVRPTPTPAAPTPTPAPAPPAPAPPRPANPAVRPAPTPAAPTPTPAPAQAVPPAPTPPRPADLAVRPAPSPHPAPAQAAPPSSSAADSTAPAEAAHSGAPLPPPGVSKTMPLDSHSARSLFYDLSPMPQSLAALSGAGAEAEKKAAAAPAARAGSARGLPRMKARAPAATPAETAAAPRAAHLGVKYSVLRKLPDGRFIEADPSRLEAGDTIRLRFVPNDDGYLYVAESGPGGASQRIASVRATRSQPFETPPRGPGAAGRQDVLVWFSRQPQNTGAVPVARQSGGQMGLNLVRVASDVQSEADLEERATYVVNTAADPASQRVIFTITLSYR